MFTLFRKNGQFLSVFFIFNITQREKKDRHTAPGIRFAKLIEETAHCPFPVPHCPNSPPYTSFCGKICYLRTPSVVFKMQHEICTYNRRR